MPTIVAHALFAWSLTSLGRRRLPSLALVHAATPCVLAMLPDADVVAFRLGVAYAEPLGHRGMSHSLVFAACTAAVATFVVRYVEKRQKAEVTLPWWLLYVLLFAAAASHPLLDMLTNGGLGCALLAPLSWQRMFFGWRPIPVSPIGLHADLWGVMSWEALFFLPIAVAALLFQRPKAGLLHGVGALLLLCVPIAIGLGRTWA